MKKRLSDKEWKTLWSLKPFISTDSVVVRDKSILLIKRATWPYKGYWALPGGLMDVGETVEKCALREVKEETGVTARIIMLVGVYSGPKRDPRGTTAAATYLMRFVKMDGKADSESSDVRFFPINKIPKRLAFDHKRIIEDAFKLFFKRKV